ENNVKVQMFHGGSPLGRFICIIPEKAWFCQGKNEIHRAGVGVLLYVGLTRGGFFDIMMIDFILL
ncbi:MAG: hypothetical protein IJC15_02705, partial [Clostridia bacterium]|nr:hypothetical protein [Clostridia bacterium]